MSAEVHKKYAVHKYKTITQSYVQNTEIMLKNFTHQDKNVVCSSYSLI